MNIIVSQLFITHFNGQTFLLFSEFQLKIKLMHKKVFIVTYTTFYITLIISCFKIKLFKNQKCYRCFFLKTYFSGNTKEMIDFNSMFCQRRRKKSSFKNLNKNMDPILIVDYFIYAIKLYARSLHKLGYVGDMGNNEL